MVRAKDKAAGKEMTRQAILDAARAVFERKGYEASSTDEIARKAGVSKGTVYFHFRRKQELFLAVVQGEIERISNRLDHLLSTFVNPAEALLSLTRGSLAEAKSFVELGHVVMSVWMRGRRELRAKLSELFEQTRSRQSKMVEEVLEKVTLPPRLRGIDKPLLAHLFMACAAGLGHGAVLREVFPAKKVVDALGAVFFGRRG